MLFVEDSILLIENLNSYSYKDFLIQYSKIANDVLYQSPKSINNLTKWFRKNLREFAYNNSPFYRKQPWNKIINKNDLSSEDWYVSNIDCFNTHTSGTTKDRFSYRIWSDIYDAIERRCHYKLIVDEFFKNYEHLNVLYCMLDGLVDPSTDALTTVHQSNNIIISHGLKTQATVHEVIANKTYFCDYYQFYHDLLFYATDNKIDIILTQSNVIDALMWNAMRLNYNRPICKLLSNTGEKLNLSNVIRLLSLGCIEEWCDHMRCWDGGASFFTCLYGTYHLMDNLSWVRSDSKNRLISDDYFSLPNPFVNYWNGDYIKVSNDYSKCRCGRYYRDFEMNRTRDIYANTYHSSHISKILKPFSDIKRIDRIGDFMRVFTTRVFKSDERQEIRKSLTNYNINFIVEN